jgi:ABC-type nitrate/sulfonate/bicarbonate transport system permease component
VTEDRTPASPEDGAVDAPSPLLRPRPSGPDIEAAGATEVTADPAAHPIKAMLFSDRAARWACRIMLIVIWQIAGEVSDRFPTPIGTLDFIIEEFRRPYGTAPWTLFNNEVITNLFDSLRRTAAGLLLVVAVGVPVGFAMGMWWRVQGFLTDLVTVGLALPAYIWALLGIMWFGFTFRAPVFVVFISATPALIVHVLQGALAIPRELRDMSGAYDVPFNTQFRNLVLPSIAGALLAGVRLAIIAAWGCVALVEWFGNDIGSGYRARLWYDVGDFNGLMGWAVIILVVVIVIDRGILERIDRAAHRWRGELGGFGAGAQKST